MWGVCTPCLCVECVFVWGCVHAVCVWCVYVGGGRGGGSVHAVCVWCVCVLCVFVCGEDVVCVWGVCVCMCVCVCGVCGGVGEQINNCIID